MLLQTENKNCCYFQYNSKPPRGEGGGGGRLRIPQKHKIKTLITFWQSIAFLHGRENKAKKNYSSLSIVLMIFWDLLFPLPNSTCFSSFDSLDLFADLLLLFVFSFLKLYKSLSSRSIGRNRTLLSFKILISSDNHFRNY